MRLLAMTCFCVGLFFGGVAHAEEADAVSKAEAAAVQWLALVDAGDYSASWDQAAELFRGSISKASWKSALRGVRAPLGAVKSRRLRSARFTRTLPGAPDGEYVVIQFDTRFSNKEAALETVTPLREKNGYWRVSGYYIK